MAVGSFCHEEFVRNDPEASGAIAALVQAGLGKTGRWTFVERGETDRILDELSLSPGGFVAVGDAARAGKLLKADLLLTGTIVTAVGSPSFVVLEVVELARAEPLGSVRVELKSAMERGRLTVPSAVDIERVVTAAAELLVAAEKRLADQRDRIIIKPLYFGNASASQRLDGSERVLLAALEDAAGKGRGHRVLSLVRPEAGTSEYELQLLGLVGADNEAWSRVADYYVWGIYEEQNMAGRAAGDCDVSVTVTVWDGRSEPVRVSANGPVRTLATVAASVAQQVIAAASERARGSLGASGLAQRKKVAGLLAQRAATLRATEAARNQVTAVARQQLFRMEQCRLLATAVFFDPAEKKYWVDLWGTWLGDQRPTDLQSLLDRMRTIEIRQDLLQRFLVATDGQVDAALAERAIGRNPNDVCAQLCGDIEYFAERQTDPFLVRNLLSLERVVEARYRAAIVALGRTLAASKPVELRGYRLAASHYLSIALTHPFSDEERRELVDSLWPRLKVALFVERAWYAMGDRDRQVAELVRLHFVERNDFEGARTTNVLSPSELALSLAAPAPEGCPAWETLRSISMEKKQPMYGVKSAAKLAEWQRRYDYLRAVAAAYLETHGGNRARAEASFGDLLGGPISEEIVRQLEPPGGETPAAQRCQAEWLRSTATERAAQGYPVSALTPMRERADLLERSADQAEAASEQSTPLAGFRGDNGFVATASMQGAMVEAGPRGSPQPGQEPGSKLPGTVWTLHDNDESVFSLARESGDIGAIIPWGDDLWLLGDFKLWRHHLAEGSVEPMNAQLGLTAKVLTILQSGRQLWVGTEGEGVWRVDLDTLAVRRFGLADGLLSLTVAQLIDLDGVILAIEAPADPYCLLTGPWTLAPKEQKAIVSRLDPGAKQWTAFDPFSDSPASGLRRGFTYRAHGNKLIVTSARSVIDLRTGAIRSLVPNLAAQSDGPTTFQPTMEAGPGFLMSGSDGTDCWLSSPTGLSQVDLETGELLRRTLAPCMTVIASDARHVYGATPAGGADPQGRGNSELLVFDRSTLALIGRRPIGAAVLSMATDGRRLWVGCRGNSFSLVEIDLAGLLAGMGAPGARQESAVTGDGGARAGTIDRTSRADALCQAAWRGDVVTMGKLVNDGANPNQSLGNGWTPLLAAVRGGERDAAAWLLAKGAGANQADFRGRYPLRIAYERGDQAMFDLLLEKGRADVNFCGTARTLPLGWPGDWIYRPTLQTVLHLAVLRNDVEMVRRLRKAGAAADRPDAFGQTALSIARQRRAHALLPLLGEAPAAAAVVSSPQRAGLSRGKVVNKELVILAVEHLDPRNAGYHLNRPVREGGVAEVAAYLQRGAPRGALGGTLAEAIRSEQWTMVAYLLSLGIDLLQPWPEITDPLTDSMKCSTGAACLALAAIKGRADLVDRFLQAGVRLQKKDHCGAVAVQQLALFQDSALLRKLLEAGADPDGGGGAAASPLALAIRRHDTELLRLLVAAHADPSATVGEGRSLLTVFLESAEAARPRSLPQASIQFWSQAIEYFTEPHAVLGNPLLPDFPSLLDLAACEDWLEGTQILLATRDAKTDEALVTTHPHRFAKVPAVRALILRAEMEAMDGDSAETRDGIELFTAIAAGDVSKFRASVAKPGALGRRGPSGESALMRAALERQTGFVRELLRAGLSLSDTASNGTPVLSYAVHGGDVELLREMVRGGADVNFAGNGANRPLEAALSLRDSKMAVALLELGASPQPRSPESDISPLALAAKRDMPDMVEELVRRGANPRDLIEGYTLFFPAARSNNPALIRFCQEHGVSLDQRSAKGWTPLYTAVRWGAAESVRELDRLGLKDPKATALAVRLIKELRVADKPSAGELRILHYRPDYPRVLEVLQETGQIAGSREAQDSIFWSRRHSLAELEAFRKSGGDLNQRGSITPLQGAAGSGDVDLLKWLLTHSADPNLAGQSEDRPPLWHARNSSEMVQLLLEHGANPNWIEYGPSWAPSAHSLLSLLVGEQVPPLQTIRLLVQHGADPNLRVARTSASLEVSLPPPMAKSGLPPPLPPSLAQSSPTILPACLPLLIAAGEQRATTEALSPMTAPSCTTPSPIFASTCAPRARRASGASAATTAETNLRPSFSTALAASSSARPAEAFCS
ncbi:MAG: ankyrin repeat domain-containing protein [Opitutaceae bacterium]|nr:ankyrin repeat domain-containing protein [Opitutaceae bacterium]